MLDKYIAKIKKAETDKEIRYILSCFFIESMLSEDFKNKVIDEIEENEDEE